MKYLVKMKTSWDKENEYICDATYHDRTLLQTINLFMKFILEEETPIEFSIIVDGEVR